MPMVSRRVKFSASKKQTTPSVVITSPAAAGVCPSPDTAMSQFASDLKLSKVSGPKFIAAPGDGRTPLVGQAQAFVIVSETCAAPRPFLAGNYQPRLH